MATPTLPVIKPMSDYEIVKAVPEALGPLVGNILMNPDDERFDRVAKAALPIAIGLSAWTDFFRAPSLETWNQLALVLTTEWP